MRTAYGRRTVTAVIIPADVQELDYIRARRTRSRWCPPASAWRTTPRCPPTTTSRGPPRCSTPARRSRSCVGQGARGARAEVEQVADLLGAGVAKALLGKDVLSDDLPYVTGSIGLLGTRPSYELMQGCDTLLVIGSSFPYTQFLPELGPGAGGADRHRPAHGRHALPVRGQPRRRRRARHCKRLLPLLERRRSTAPGARRSRRTSARWWEVMERRAAVDADPINPEYVAHALDALLPDDVILAADSGSAANWYARHLRHARRTMRGSLSGTLATMGPGVPYVIGAKFAHPRPARDRARRRRRDADERHGRADHRREVLAAVAGPAAGRRGAQQPRPQPGHLGDARHVRRPAVPALPGPAGRRPTPTSPGPSGWTASGWRSPTTSRTPGTGRWPPTGPSSSTSAPTRPCRRSRRTPPWTRSRPPPPRSSRATATGRACVKQGFKAKVQEILPGNGHGENQPGKREDDARRLGHRAGPVVEGIETAVYTVPTDAPKADGTLAWDSTTLVLAPVRSGNTTGIGCTYGAPAAAQVIDQLLAAAGRRTVRAGTCRGQRGDAPGGAQRGPPGLVAGAISAVDIALWDLKARLLGLPLAVCWALPARGAGLRKRRLHHLRRAASRTANCATGPRSRASPGSRSRSESHWGRRAPRLRRVAHARAERRRRTRTVRGRQRRLQRQTGHPPRHRAGRPRA